jgi:hypothetical protein
MCSAHKQRRSVGLLGRGGGKAYESESSAEWAGAAPLRDRVGQDRCAAEAGTVWTPGVALSSKSNEFFQVLTVDYKTRLFIYV